MAQIADRRANAQREAARPWSGSDAAARPWRRWRAPSRAQALWGGGATLLLAAIVFFFLFIFQWNWLRGPLANELGLRLHRQVVIRGNLNVHLWSWNPSATVEGLAVGNPDWAGPGPLVVFPRLTVTVHAPDLLQGRLTIPSVVALHPDVHLVRGADDRANWNFSPGESKAPLRLPAVSHIIIDQGRLRFEDRRRNVTFTGLMSSNEGAAGPQRSAFHLQGQGFLKRVPFAATVVGGPMLNVSPDRPYPFVAEIHQGATRVSAQGTIPHPFDLGHLRAQLTMSGDDLARLYDLTGLALPATPPYRLTASLTRDDQKAELRNIRGHFGESDLAGSLTVNERDGRPLMVADLMSRRLKMTDLGAIVGAASTHGGHPLSAAQQVMATRLRAEHRVLPDAKLPLARVRAMDARISYRADTVDWTVVPVRRLSMKVDLDHGVLTVSPLSMTLPQGALSGLIRIDARGSVSRENIDLRLAGARLEDLVPRGRGNPPLVGAFVARARLSAVGDSLRAAAATSNGEVALAIPSGQIRQSLAELMGINVTKGLFLLLTKNERETPLRCAVADFRAQNGVLTTQQFVLDTGVVLANGRGVVDMRNETIDLRVSGKSKKFRLVHIGAPITLKGRFESPRIGIDLAPVAGQVTVGALLGVAVSPFAAILPFIDLGLAKDANCGALLSQASSEGAPVPARR